ncbi:MAG: hypothetical protein CME32_14965 [Gimesia sp.]|nr:hypothetical protein [Gimesia sp.]
MSFWVLIIPFKKQLGTFGTKSMFIVRRYVMMDSFVALTKLGWESLIQNTILGLTISSRDSLQILGMNLPRGSPLLESKQ